MFTVVNPTFSYLSPDNYFFAATIAALVGFVLMPGVSWLAARNRSSLR